MIEIRWLDQPGCDDTRVVGGKAANLGHLAGDFLIPAGFCLTAAMYDRWAATDPLPSELRAAISEAYEALGRRCGVSEPVVAVRSSAVDEDGADASFAGMFLSCLNLRGVEQVLEGLARCWAAAADPRVVAYRADKGLAGGGLAVLVQALVFADVSAVVFSHNPTNGATDEIVINANFGLGESIVSGTVTPDTWLLARPGLETRRFILGDKAQMTVRSEAGTHEVPVLRSLRRRPCLSEGQVRELADLALRLEATMGWPVDIECAYEGDTLKLLQCRPITTGAV